MDGLVLIADDDERNARLARDVLEASGFTTLVASTGEAAVALARERTPDVVLLDLRLPDVDGAEVMRRLAADEGTAGIPVVASSAIRAGDVEAWAREAGFADYVEKPIDVGALPERLRGAMQR
jgi:two-component system, cell cycle response regulator DivK